MTAPAATAEVRAFVLADWTLRGHYRLFREQPPLDPAGPPRSFRWSIVGAFRYADTHAAYWRGRQGEPPANDWHDRYDTAAWLAGVDDQALVDVPGFDGARVPA